MLKSSFLADDKELSSISEGKLVMEPAEESDAVGLIQCALLAAGFPLPDTGCDGVFGPEMEKAVGSFQADRELSSRSGVVDAETLSRLDLECAFLEGNTPQNSEVDVQTGMNDPFFAGVLELQGTSSVLQSVIDTFDLGDRICLRASFILMQEFVPGVQSIAALVGRFVEPFIVKDYVTQNGASTLDFFDLKMGSSAYTTFLVVNNPTIDPGVLQDLGQKSRPDILRHRPPFEWYEIKPYSISGSFQALLKLGKIAPNFAAAGVPYQAGLSYTPSRDISTFILDSDAGETIELVIMAIRAGPGLIFYTLCLKGDGVRYMNRVRTVAGLLGILVAAGIIALPAVEAGALIEAVTALAKQFGIAALPVLTARAP